MNAIQRKLPFRISLRTVAILVTVLCLALGWTVRQAEQQKMAVARLEAIGGKVRYGFQFTATDSVMRDATGSLYYLPDLQAAPPGPSWLRQRIGVDYFAKVVSVNLRNRPNDNEALGSLANLTQLRHLNLSNVKVADVSFLAKLTKVEMLDLGGTKVTDLSPLANLTELRLLRLRGNTSNLPSCDGPICDLTPLKQLTQLEELDVSYNPITDLSPLVALINLTKLDVSATRVQELAPLAALTRLKSLDLSCTEISDLSPLSNLKSLATLDLNLSPHVSDLTPLRRLANLKVLNLCANDQIEEGEVQLLRRALPNCTISR